MLAELLIGLSRVMKISFLNCDALRDLVPFAQFKKREKHPWMSITFSKVAGFYFTKSNAPLWVFFTFFKLYKWYQIAHHIIHINLLVNNFNHVCSTGFNIVDIRKRFFRINYESSKIPTI